MQTEVAAPTAGVVQLFLLPEPESLSAELAGEFGQWLSDAERERWSRFQRVKDRNRFLLSRALLRSVLGRLLQQAPAALVFTIDRYGKPELEQLGVGTEQRLRFSLSHADGLIALAVSLSSDVGVDVENTDRPVEILPLAKRYFAATETQLLEQTPPDEQLECFFKLWTLKEAYVKAIGFGLQVGLDSFAFEIKAALAPRLISTNGSEGAAWSFYSMPVRGKFQLSVAINSSAVRFEQNAIDAEVLGQGSL